MINIRMIKIRNAGTAQILLEISLELAEVAVTWALEIAASVILTSSL